MDTNYNLITNPGVTTKSKRGNRLLTLATVAMLTISMLVSPAYVFAGKAPTSGTPNKITAAAAAVYMGKAEVKWSSGNSGEADEGDWSPAYIRLENVDWATLPEKIGVDFDFYRAQTDSIFFDLVRGISVGTTNLESVPANAADYPFYDTDGTSLPLTSVDDINAAQQYPYEGVPEHFKLVRELASFDADQQINVGLGSTTGSVTDQQRRWYITKDQIKEALDAALALQGSSGTWADQTSFTIYFEMHLARTSMWKFLSNNVINASAYAQSPTDDWGGVRYTDTFLTKDPKGGAGPYSNGAPSSTNVISQLNATASWTTGPTIPCPGVPELLGKISGIKYVDANDNKIYDPGEEESGWPVFCRSDMDGIPNVEMTTTTNGEGYFEFTALSADYIYEITEATTNDSEVSYLQIYPNTATSGGTGVTKIDTTVSPYDDYATATVARAQFGWLIDLSQTTSMQATVNFGNLASLPGIAIDKKTNGLDHGILIPVGDDVTWTYDVTNTGNVPLSDIRVTDDQDVTPLPVDDDIDGYNDGDTNENGKLDLTEIWLFEATGTATANLYENIGYVRGTSPSAEYAYAQDDSDYYGSAPGINIVKKTNGIDGDAGYIKSGAAVVWTYIVTNTGNVPLSNIQVEDDQGVTPVPVDEDIDGFNDGDTNLNDELDLTETWEYEASGTTVAGSYANTGTATGTPPVGDDVTDDDNCSYFGTAPDFTITKTADHSLTNPACPGHSVEYTYTIENTGNIPLDLTGISDEYPSETIDLFAAAKAANGDSVLLEPGTANKITFKAQYQVPFDVATNVAFENTVTANFVAAATYPSYGTLTESDDYAISLFSPRIKIIKTGYAQSADGHVTYEITIMNMTTENSSYLTVDDLPEMHYILEDRKLLGSFIVAGDLKCYDDPDTTWDDTLYTISIPWDNKSISKTEPFSNKATVDAWPVGFEDVVFFLFF